MVNEHTLHLINARLDGELTPEEQEELETTLANSAEARTLEQEWQRLGAMLDEAPELDPPAELSRRILSDVVLPDHPAGQQPHAQRLSLSRLLRSFRPAPIGLAFASGLLVAVAVYELAPGPGAPTDTSQMVGTMVPGKTGSNSAHSGSLQFNEAGIEGFARLRNEGNIYVLDVELDSVRPSEFELALNGTGLRFGGIRLDSSNAGGNQGNYTVSGGAVRVANQGRQAFSIILAAATAGPAVSREIRIGISSSGQAVYSGTLPTGAAVESR
jgi:hypothetical protein